MAAFVRPSPPARRSGYQAYISLFMAPTNYSLGDYNVIYSDADILSSQQAAQARIKIYNPTIPDTWGSLWSAAGNSYSQFISGGQMAQVGWDECCPAIALAGPDPAACWVPVGLPSTYK